MSDLLQNPKGTRDYDIQHSAKRDYLFNLLEAQFKLFGYYKIQTPALENLATLMNNYGQEGEQLLYKIRSNKNFIQELSKTVQATLLKAGIQDCYGPSDKALKYDLTIPLIRFIKNNISDIKFPFKRYQIQPVWRADRPQKGRYTEFMQCDIDVVGSASLFYEAELLYLCHLVLEQLGFKDYRFDMNNRKILESCVDILKCREEKKDFFLGLDKLDKIGWDKVIEEWEKKGIDNHKPFFDNLEFKALSAKDKILKIKEFFPQHLLFQEGCQEIISIIAMLENFNFPLDKLNINLSMVRGLAYYTGTIFEVSIANKGIGSIAAGGRYEMVMGKNHSSHYTGVGLSFGAERIYDLLLEKNFFKDYNIERKPKVMLCNMGKERMEINMKFLSKLRTYGIEAILYAEDQKMQKQFKYADALNIKYVIIIGPDELKDNTFKIKNMQSGHQEKYSLDKPLHEMNFD